MDRCAPPGDGTSTYGAGATLRANRRSRQLGCAEVGPRMLGGASRWGSVPRGQSVYSVTVSMDEHARVTFYTLVPETGTGAHTVGRQVVAGGPGIRSRT